MFKIKKLTIKYKDRVMPDDIYNFGEINDIYGNNKTGKTIFIKMLDFVLGSSENVLSGLEGTTMFDSVECEIESDYGSEFFKRSINDNKFGHKISQNDSYLFVSDFDYKKIIQKHIAINDYTLINDLQTFLEEQTSYRSFVFFNAINEKDISNITNLFYNSDKYFNIYRSHKIMDFLFNYSNIKDIIKYEKICEQYEKHKKEHQDAEKRKERLLNNIYTQLIKINYKDKIDEKTMKEYYKKYLFEKNNEKINTKDKETDMADLLRIFYSISEELKLKESIMNASNNLISTNNEANALLSNFKSLLDDNPNYEQYISPIINLIEENSKVNEILNVVDYQKTLTELRNKRNRVLEEIKKRSEEFSKYDYLNIIKITGIIDNYFKEFNLLKQNNTFINEAKQYDDAKAKIKTLKKLFDEKVLNDFNSIINENYKKLNDVKLVEDNLNDPDFEIQYNPISHSLNQINKRSNKRAMPGSNAKMTVWQFISYVSIFAILKKYYPTLPYIKILMIDGFNQTFDTNISDIKKIFDSISKICKENDIQLFVTSTIKLTDSNECNPINLNNGLNKYLISHSVNK